MRRYKEDYIPGDKKSFSQKYGVGASLINEEDDDLVPEFVKKIFESNNSAPKNEKLNESKVKKLKEDESDDYYRALSAVVKMADNFDLSTSEGRNEYVDLIQNVVAEALGEVEQDNDIEFGKVVIEL